MIGDTLGGYDWASWEMHSGGLNQAMIGGVLGGAQWEVLWVLETTLSSELTCNGGYVTR